MQWGGRRRGKRTAFVVLAVTMAGAAISACLGRGYAVDSWWIWRLGSEDRGMRIRAVGELAERKCLRAVPRIVDVIAKDPLEDVTIRLVNFNRYHTQPEGVVVYEASTVCGRLWEMGETALPALKLALEEYGSDPRMRRILERLLDRSGPLARQGDLVWK